MTKQEGVAGMGPGANDMVASMHAMSIGIGEVLGPLLGGFASEHLPKSPVGDLPAPGGCKNISSFLETHLFSTVLWICSNGDMATGGITARKDYDVFYNNGNISLYIGIQSVIFPFVFFYRTSRAILMMSSY